MTRDEILKALCTANPAEALKAHDTTELHARLARAQPRMKNLNKDTTVKIATKGGGSFAYAFAPLESYLDMAREAYAAEGLSFTQHVDGAPSGRDQIITVTSAVTFGTASVTSSMSCASGGSTQDYGAVITYLRRYTLQALTATTGTNEDEDAAPIKTGPRVDSDNPAKRERAAEIRNAAKAKAAQNAEAAAWPQVSYPPGMPEDKAGIRHIGERVMRILGADFCSRPPPEALDRLADQVGWAMIEHLADKPSTRAEVEDFCSRVERAAKSEAGMAKLKDRASAVLDVPF